MPQVPVTLSIDHGLAIVTLSNPDAGNAIDQAFCDALLAVAITVDEDPAVRCVLINAQGRMFSVGGNLAAFALTGADIGAALKAMTAPLHAALSRLGRMGKPLVVAVHGPAAGAGMSLALLGDIVISGKAATFTAAYTAVGLTPDGGMTYLLPRLVGLRAAQELILTNRRLSADEALAMGLVTRVVEDADLSGEAEKTARRLADGPIEAFGEARALLLESLGGDYETQMEREARAISRRAGSAEGQEGITAFLAKRRPVFGD